MGRVSVVLFFIMVSLVSCQRDQNHLIGRWEVERVNVEFDESKATPEMVRQYGEMERGNAIVISKDSVLTFIAGDDTVVGKWTLEGRQLYCDGEPFGIYENGTIRTKTSTPLGIIEVIYRK